MNILIVDDVATNRKLMRAVLEAEGHQALEAADGVEAMRVLEREGVDAVISDILMPNMDGFRLVHEIRKSPALRGIACVIYSSTYTSPNDIKLAEAVGADRYLAKPAPTEAVLRALEEAAAGGTTRLRVAAAQPEETYVLKQYSEALVNKLEEKNTELQQALEALRRAHDRIVELNAGLEKRVRERTWELEKANLELTQALAEVKELSGLVPICGYCKKIRNDSNFWQTVESYVASHSKVKFSHSVCPECQEKIVKPQMDRLLKQTPGNRG